MNLGFKVQKKHAVKEDGHNGEILPEIQEQIENAARDYCRACHGWINMNQARTTAYGAFWQEWRSLKK